MTLRRDFNAEEWSQIVHAPAALSVAAAERGGTLRETMSLSRAYAEAREHADLELLKEILSTPPAIDAGRIHSPEDLAVEATRGLREAVQMLEGRATADEIDDYKRFSLWLAENVARAHKEGGFLGVGGKQVSERERAALDELAAALDLPRG
jgi:hypothetical protein